MKNKTADSATGALEGNTKTSKAKLKEVKKWCFTLHNWTEAELKKLQHTAVSGGHSYIYGKEICPETGRPHLQCFIKLTTKKSFSAVVKLLDIPRIHVEPCRGTESENIIYCSKDKNFMSNLISDEPLKLITELRPWQLDIVKIIEQSADERVVNWLYEPIGRFGKSSFCKYLCAKYNAIYIDEGKKSDLINIIYNVKILNSKTIICIDIPRTNENKVSFKAIEQFKNGMICNTKYETGMRIFNSPHIFIFSNFHPDVTQLSADRWNITKLKNNEWPTEEEGALPL